MNPKEQWEAWTPMERRAKLWEKLTGTEVVMVNNIAYYYQMRATERWRIAVPQINVPTCADWMKLAPLMIERGWHMKLIWPTLGTNKQVEMTKNHRLYYYGEITTYVVNEAAPSEAEAFSLACWLALHAEEAP